MVAARSSPLSYDAGKAREYGKPAPSWPGSIPRSRTIALAVRGGRGFRRIRADLGACHGCKPPRGVRKVAPTRGEHRQPMQAPDPSTSAAKGDAARGAVPATLAHPAARRFWLAVVLIGIGAGVRRCADVRSHDGAALGLAPGEHRPSASGERRRVLAPCHHIDRRRNRHRYRADSARESPCGNSIEITSAIWFSAGRLPTLRTLGSALLSVIIVGMGASLGREGAPSRPAP